MKIETCCRFCAHRRVDRVDEEPDHWFEPIADHLGAAYLRYSFTKGTEQEVDFLVDALGLEPGMRVLDVGCGPGRHAHELARRGIAVHGVDISQRSSTWPGATPRPAPPSSGSTPAHLPFDAEFDAAISLCQGAFGLVDRRAGEDAPVLAGMARAVRPGGRLAVSAFNAYFQVRYREGTSTPPPASTTSAPRSATRAARRRAVDLWTTCFTPTRAALARAGAGLGVDASGRSSPGAYRATPPTVERAGVPGGRHRTT